MALNPIHRCGCTVCQKPDDNAIKELHALMNYFLSTLDESQQRIFVGMEAKKRGDGADAALAVIIGWTEEAIAVAKREVERLVSGDATEEVEEQPVVIRQKVSTPTLANIKTPYGGYPRPPHFGDPHKKS